MKVGVVGGGWAGLAAAVALLDAGVAEVTVLEAGHHAGGRARAVEHPDFPAGLDNGQHILLGAYDASQALIERLHPGGLTAALLRLPLQLDSLDGRFALHAPRWLPAPLHALAALAGARGLSLPARLQAIRLMRALQAWQWQPPQGWTVAELLDQQGQSAALRARLWHPLCLAALNTPPAQACATLFAAVLRDALAQHRRASDLLLPRCDLSALWPQAATERLQWRPGALVEALSKTPEGWQTAGRYHGQALHMHFDALVLAVPPPVATRLLQALAPAPGSPRLLAALQAFEFEAIATLYLRLAQPWRLPAAMLQLDDANGTLPGHWIFDRASLTGRPDAGELSIVGSAAGPWLARPREALIQALEDQWRTQWALRSRAPAPPATAAQALIIEKRATFAATPGLVRPAARTPWRGLLLAGDWTDTGYPGVLEGAVRSGQTAARELLASVAPAQAQASGVMVSTMRKRA